MRKIIIMLLIGTFVFLAAGCSIKVPDGSEQIDVPISVYTTLYVLEDFATQIGGERVRAVNLIPAGVNPHDYEPSARDITAVVKGDLFIYNGAGMELWISNVLTNLRDTQVRAVNASERVQLMETSHAGHSSSYDPHTWLSPTNAILIAQEIRDALISIRPEHTKYFNDNYLLLEEELLDLHENFQQSLGNLEHKEFYISHAAFGYLAEAYGLIQHSISGYTAEDEPSLSELRELSERISRQDTKYILVDKTESTKIAEVLAAELGLETIPVYTMGSLTTDRAAAGLNYLELMEENRRALLKALTE